MAKNIVEKTRPVWKFLPYGSLINHLDKGFIKNNSATKLSLKLIGHIAYVFIPTMLGARYVINRLDTDSWNPIEQRRIIVERKAEQANLQERYDFFFERIFRDGGLADSNNNGMQYSEVADGFSRAGHDYVPTEVLEGLRQLTPTAPISPISFPRLSINELETITKSYWNDMGINTDSLKWMPGKGHRR